MSDAYTVLNPGVGGDTMDESGVTFPTAPLVRKRARVIMTGEGMEDIASVIQTPPAGTEYGIVTRSILSPYPGTQNVLLGNVTIVPSSTETTVSSYTVPGGTNFYFLGFVGSGNVNATYRLYVDTTPMLSGISSVSVPTVNVNFSYSIFTVAAGSTVRLKATHFSSGVQADKEVSLHSATAFLGCVTSTTAVSGIAFASSASHIRCVTKTQLRGGMIFNIPTATSGGVSIGGAGISTYLPDQGGCKKPSLPLHPHPSIADYSPQSVAPLMDFFLPIVQQVIHDNKVFTNAAGTTALTHCNIEFRYENNTPCNPNDDIFVRHPLCIGEVYEGPKHPCGHGTKSEALLLYEKYAKKSKRLKDFMDNSPAKIEYFHDLCFSDV